MKIKSLFPCITLSYCHIDADETETGHQGPFPCGETIVLSAGELDAHVERRSYCTFLFPFLWAFPCHPRTCLWDTEKPCGKPHKPRPTLPTYVPWLQFWAFQQTRILQAGIPTWCPPALTVCPSSCSIFPDKYHRGQSIKHISLFLRRWRILWLPLPHCYVMSFSPPISQSTLFTSLSSLHAL